jgi:D-sedoheptulose 7-phosphate isomerase
MRAWLQEYLQDQSRIALALPVNEIEEWIRILQKARENNAHIFSCGNGGSASNSSHFATDLGKGASGLVPPDVVSEKLSTGKRFRVSSLNDNVSWMTALGNDSAYEDVYIEQLKNFAKSGDVFIGISVSGNSPNILKAAQWSKENGLTVLALVGNRPNKLLSLASRSIAVDGSHYGRVEDAHMHILHLLCYAFIEGRV